jgi:N-methylhydantoinase B
MSSISPITLEVVTEGLIAIVKEMRATIIRAAYSSAIYEFNDFSCALFNGDGDLVAQSWDHPGHVLPLPYAVNAMFEDFKDLAPGDVILVNDCYRGGTHLNDVALIFPIFDQDGRVVIFPAVRAHWVDVGGMYPGSYSGLATNVYQEGVRIPPIKIMEGGKMNHAAFTLLMANMRVSEEREGDLQASLGACRIAEQRIRRLYEKYGAETVHACVALNLKRTEARMRGKIAELPDGEYFYEDYLEYFDNGKFDPVLMKVCLKVSGDSMFVDFTGSNRQVPGVVNSSIAVTGAGVIVAIKSTLDPGGAVNQGTFRPIEIKAPPGTIVNVRADAPAGAHGEVRKRAVSVTMAALSQMRPEIVSGDLCGTSFPSLIGGWNAKRNRQFVYFEAPAGGNGGFQGGDGSSAFANVDFGNLPTIQPAEAMEKEMPIRIRSSELCPDTGGSGAWRGGLGLKREVELLCDQGTYSLLSDRAVLPPFGVRGGKSGRQNTVKVQQAGGITEFSTPGKAAGFPLQRGDVVIIQSAGAGGYGDPLERDVELVRTDVELGYVTREKARDDFGVVIDAAGGVDSDATNVMREHLRSQVQRLRVGRLSNRDPYIGVRGRRRTLALNKQTFGRLGVEEGDLVELLGRHAAPLRAWVILDDTLADDTIELDDFGRRVLGLSEGDEAIIRCLAGPAVQTAF